MANYISIHMPFLLIFVSKAKPWPSVYSVRRSRFIPCFVKKIPISWPHTQDGVTRKKEFGTFLKICLNLPDGLAGVKVRAGKSRKTVTDELAKVSTSSTLFTALTVTFQLFFPALRGSKSRSKGCHQLKLPRNKVRWPTAFRSCPSIRLGRPFPMELAGTPAAAPIGTPP
jgi:hypothetical protein